MTYLCAKITIITRNTNGLNIPIKRQRLLEWIKKYYPTICYLKETHFKYKHIVRLKKMEKYIIHTLIKGRQEWLHYQIKQISEQKNLPRQGHYIMIKMSVHLEDITILNVMHPKTELQNMWSKN